jgi:bla regulator protein BlaR1
MLIEYVLRTSLIAAVIGLVLYVMRIRTASARHAAWSSVVLVMLLLPAWLAWGPKASLPILPRAADQRLNQRPTSPLPVYAPQPSGAGLRPATQTEPQPLAVWDRGALFAGIYLLGVFFLLTRLAIGTLRTIRLTSASCVVPATVGFFRPRIILPESSSAWPQTRLDAVLIHEREHARRRDPLFKWIALLNRALFWFHPLAWWLERRLSALAEEACDAAVLAHGHDPHDYSETLLDLSRSVELAGARLNVIGMSMPGAALPQRIRRMLSGAPVPSISRPRLACAAAICAAATALLAAGTLVHAQSQSQPRPAFEVASVKPTMQRHGGPRLDGARYSDAASLRSFVVMAYGLNSCAMRAASGIDCPLISGLPAWAKTPPNATTDLFEIQATLPDNPRVSSGYTAPQVRMGEVVQLDLMLQVLLEDRFHLKFHRETKELPVYTLTVGKNGAKLKQTAAPHMVTGADGASVEQHGFAAFEPVLSPDGSSTGRRRITFRGGSMQQVADSLTTYSDRPVLDRTGLKGEYDLTIDYEVDQGARNSGGGVLANLFSGLTCSGMSSALQDVGLKCESTKGAVEVLVIDHVEKPSEN